jgi:aminoglycoside phosphotransferase (APT) family kinase protein
VNSVPDLHESCLRSNAVSTSDLELLGAGREAEVFAWDDGRVLRLARDSSRAEMIEREVTALAAAHEAGANVPGVHERVTVDGRPGVVLDRVDGVDLLDSLASRPWTARSVGKTLGVEHAALHRVEAPAGLPELHDELRQRLGSPLVPEDVRTRALERLAALPAGDRLLHGDFHPANLLATADGYVVIDWTNGTAGDPAADVARTILLMGGGKLADGTPVVVRVLAPVARRLLLVRYLSAYAREAPLDRDLVDRWLPVWAAARLSEDIEAERAFLLTRAR